MKTLTLPLFAFVLLTGCTAPATRPHVWVDPTPQPHPYWCALQLSGLSVGVNPRYCE